MRDLKMDELDVVSGGSRQAQVWLHGVMLDFGDVPNAFGGTHRPTVVGNFDDPETRFETEIQALADAAQQSRS